MKLIMTYHGGGKDHPYIHQLVTSLRERGVEVKFAPPGTFTLWRAVRRHGLPEVIHLQWQHPFFLAPRFHKAVWRAFWFFFQLFTLRLFGVRYVWTLHETVKFGTRRVKWELVMSRLLARVVDGIIVHCAAAVPVVAADYQIDPGCLTVVPHGHYADYYPPAVSKKEARRELGLPDEAIIFLFFGHIKPYKGIDRLVDAYAGLDEGINTRLVLLGKPHVSAPQLVRSLKERAAADPRIITRFEFIPDDLLSFYFSACDLVVLPYLNSLTSSVAVLAASYGRPILVSKIGCMGEFPTAAAFLFDPATPDSLPKALEQALSAPLEEMGAAASHYILQFPWSLVAAKTESLYRLVAGYDTGNDVSVKETWV